jgi:hypothetical protein
VTASSLSGMPDRIRTEFGRHGVRVVDIQTKVYPEETNFLVYVPRSDFIRAVEAGNDLDDLLQEEGLRAFVVVRKASEEDLETTYGPILGVHDQHVSELVRLINSRSRVSQIQPSLSYVKDASTSLTTITSPRHHLVFGRRGAGKTALLVEAQRILSAEGDLICWANIQTLRRESPHRVFLHVVEEICNVIISALESRGSKSHIMLMAGELASEATKLLSSSSDSDDYPAQRLIPLVQKMLRRFTDSYGNALYIFLDDFYYVSRSSQPLILDMLHGCVRDCNAWLKIASIRHLTRWYQSSPPAGLQTGQDADVLDLDVTLQDPGRAKRFLESVLREYAHASGVARLSSVFQLKALDRLVLASGAVPRDYLVLCASAIKKAQSRSNARVVGVQDVNQAAGDAAQVKVQELEDDLASNLGTAQRTLSALQILRTFCLEEKQSTYYRLGFKDKERNPAAYNVMTDLLDLRLLHLLDASVSEAHAAGERSEAYMLDLSQFSGSRLKRGLRVLDIEDGKIVSRGTRGNEGPIRRGDTPRQALSILRAAPVFDLELLEDLA